MTILSSLFMRELDYKAVCRFDFEKTENKKHIDTLVDEGIIRVGAYEKISETYKDEDIDEHERWYESWIKDLKRHPDKNENILNSVFYTLMAIDRVDGHCFVFLPERELIVYPHDDTGFGFISFRDSQDDNLIEHIRKHFDSDPFQVCAWHDGKPDKTSL